MPLHLYQTFSTASHLRDILGPLVARHIDFRLQDRFLILTPDEESRRDVETALLQFPQLSGILIGSSVQTLPGFFQRLHLHHPDPLPSASPWLQRRALSEAASELNIALARDSAALRSQIWELGRLQNQFALQEGFFPGKWRRLAATWEQRLAGRYQAWNRRQAALAAWEVLQRAPREIHALQDIYFLGFGWIEAEWLTTLERLLGTLPLARIHLYLPPFERLMDAEGVLAASLERLSAHAEDRIERLSETSPEVRVVSYPTPVHEYRHLLHQGNRAASLRILSPAESTTHHYLEAALSTQTDPAFAEALSRSGSTVLQHVIAECRQALGEIETEFSQFFDVLFPILQRARGHAAERRDAYSLRLLEEAFRLMNEWRRAEANPAEMRLPLQWWQDFREACAELDLPASPGARNTWLRSIDRPGLESGDRLLIAGLNEGIYPAAIKPFALAESFQDKLGIHEKNLAFERAIRLATRETILSYSEFSISGSTQAPSLFLSMAESFQPDAVLTMPIWDQSGHPFAAENIARESRRIGGLLGPDAGQLSGLGLEPYLRQKVQRTPLSASYLDDYAKCPWRFFAKWHLKLKDPFQEEMEIEPKERGKFQHRLLERMYRTWQAEFFERHRHPPADHIEQTLQLEFERLGQEMLEMEAFRAWPPALMQDQLGRFRRQVAHLLGIEQEFWNGAEAKLFPRHMEWSFGMGQGPTLEFPLSEADAVPLAGAIDRIDVSADGARYLVLDYKSSNSGELSRELRERRSFQFWIYLYAVRKILFSEAQPLGALYWDLKDRKRNQGLVRKEEIQPYLAKKTRGDSFVEDEHFDATLRELEEILRNAILKIIEGDYSLEPPACVGTRCEFNAICRYADQPR